MTILLPLKTPRRINNFTLLFRLVSVFYVDLLPYLDRCMKAAFPPIQVSKVIGNVPGVTLGLDFERVYEMLPKNFRLFVGAVYKILSDKNSCHFYKEVGRFDDDAGERG